MKKLWIVSAILIFAAKVAAQNYPAYDTLRKNEFSVNIAPVVTIFMGGTTDNYSSNFSLGYKHYFKNRVVFRSAFLVFPNANYSYNSGMPEYYRSVGNKNVFRTSYRGGGVKTQLSLGAEKIFKVNRLQHGLGSEFFVNHKFENRTEAYFYIPDSAQSSITNSNNYMHDNPVDSIGSSYFGRSIGVGLQVFYSLRYKISKHWYLSGTIGPSMNLAFSSGVITDKRLKETMDIHYTSFDFPNVPFISDVSIAFRF